MDGNQNVSTQLDGGAARVRSDKLGAVHTVNVQWTVSPFNYAYLRAFYRTATTRAASPFQMLLIIENPTPDLYVCQFVPGSFQLKSQIGLTYVVGAQLWAAPSNPTTDAAVIAAGPEA
jgi:hypothetical protein